MGSSTHFTPFPLEVHSRVVSSIKVKAEMDISEQRKPQDGRLSFDFLNESYDIRVSTLKVTYGENMVMRILASSEELYNIRSLGLDNDDIIQTQGSPPQALRHGPRLRPYRVGKDNDLVCGAA